VKVNIIHCLQLCVSFMYVPLIAADLPPATCLQAHIRPADSQSAAASSSAFETVITNKCAKPITAYAIAFYDPVDQQLGRLSIDVIARMASKETSGEILHPAHSMTLQNDLGTAVPPTVRVVAFLYHDGSASGAEETVLQLIANRKRSLEESEERLQALNTVTEYEAAGRLAAMSAAAKTANPALASYLQRLADREKVSDPRSWEIFVSRERQYYASLINAYKSHISYRRNEP